MKILHAAQSLKGGPASYFDEIIPDQIDRYGRENVALCVPDVDLAYISDRSREARAFPFSSSQRSIGSLRDFYRTFRDAVAQLKPDIVHLHSSFAGALGRIALLGAAHRPRIIYCSHGWAFDMNGGQSRAFGSAVAWVERVLAMQTDSIVNISQADQASAVDRGIGRGKNRIILNGVADLSPPDIPKEAQQQALGMDPTKTNLLFVGRFDRQKGADIAVSAMNAMDPAHYHLYLIGDYVVSSKPNENQPAILPSPAVSLLGWKDRSTLPPWFAAADALVMPSRWEGFGLAAIEAMRMKTAVIASRAGALPELVVDGHTGRLAPPDSHESLSQIFTTETKAALHAYGQSGRARFEDFFTSARLNQELAELYAELA